VSHTEDDGASDYAAADDAELSREQLDEKYNPEGDGEHPIHTRQAWREQVAACNTISGYFEWVFHMLGQA
jgi:hypothetical protein